MTNVILNNGKSDKLATSINGAQLMDKVFYYVSYLSGLSLQYKSINLELFMMKGN